MKNSFYVSLAALTALLAPGDAALAQTLSPDLAGMATTFKANTMSTNSIDGIGTSNTVGVIVQFKNPPTQSDLDAVKAIGGVYQRGLDSAGGAQFTFSTSNVSKLTTLSNVDYASPDRIVRQYLEFARPAINAQIAQQYGWDGTGVGIAVIDSGVSAVADLANANCTGSRIVYSENFPMPGAAAAYGHGTHVAGIAAGNGSCAVPNASRKVMFRGIAPAANLISLRVLDGNGNGYDSSVIAAIDRAIQLKNTFNIRVINLSLGRAVKETYRYDPLCRAVEKAWKAGIVVVVAAGNMGRYPATSGYGTVASPANDPFVITVGAMNDKQTPGRGDDVMTTYSSKGPSEYDHIVKPDLVAPGNAVISNLESTSAVLATSTTVVPTSYYSSSPITPAYMKLSGTSMAAPMVSGAVAVLLEKWPGLTPNQVKARLMKTATKNFPAVSTIVDPTTAIAYAVHYDLFTVGAGYLDIWGALNNSDLNYASATTPLSPAVVRNSFTGAVTLAAGASLVWGDSLVWGTSLVWGDTVFLRGTQQLAGGSVLWGDTTSAAASVLWGDSLVWGDSVLWGDVAQKGDN